MSATTGRTAIILLVEDDDDLRAALAEVLTAAGHVVYAVGSVLDGMAIMQAVRPALIITDLMMPEMTGHDFIRWLDESPDCASIPRIVITAATSGWAGVRAPVFIKPVRATDLTRAIDTFIGRRRSRPSLELGR